MSPSKRRFVALALVAIALPAAELAALEPDPRRIRTRNGADTAAVLLALNGAQRKLRAPECQRLFTDFRDGEGRVLAETLASLEVEPWDYLTLMVIGDGGGLTGGRVCSDVRVAAFTSLRSRVMFVCGLSFRARPAGARENALIHEMLHSLGLGENPPTPAEINLQVRRRCGR